MVDIAGAEGFAFRIDDVAAPLHVARFEGHEGLSELFRLDLTLACEDGALAFSDIVGRAATFSMPGPGQGSPRHLHGIISRFEQDEEGSLYTTYRATVVPGLFRLQLRHDCRVFHDLAAPEIARRVLAAAGFQERDYRFALHGKYRVREHCIQYRESDFAFLSRLLEDEGIHYYFEHGEDRHVLVLGDTPFTYKPLAEPEVIPFRRATGALAAGEHVARFRYAEELQPGRVTVRAYDFRNPRLDLESEARSGVNDDIEVYHPTDLRADKQSPGLADQQARIRLDAWQAERQIGVGEGNSTRLAPAAVFALSEHPRDAFNRRYLITRVEHQGEQPGLLGPGATPGGRAYQNRFRCIPADVVFRPLRRTPTPSLRGVQTAVVVGPRGEEIHTDLHGRIKVQFHWDRQGQRDEHSSAWVRVSQAWAGPGYGSMVIPRIGHEVVIDFEDGDLDRPIAVGSVYHGTNPVPHGLPAAAGVSTLKSSSTPGGKGYNELRFDDTAGAEEIHLHGERDWSIDIGNDKAQTIAHDETLSVGHDRSKTVDGDEREQIGGNKSIGVGGAHDERIGADEAIVVGGSSSRTVSANRSEMTGENRSLVVGANSTEVIGQSLSLMVGAAKTETVASDSQESVGGKKTLTVGGEHAMAVGDALRVAVSGSHTEEIDGEKTTRVGQRIVLTCGKSRVVLEADGRIVLHGDDIEIRSPGPVKVEGTRLKVKSAGTVDLQAAGAVQVKGTRLKFN